MEKKKVPFVLICLLTSAILVACSPSQADRNAQATTIAADIFPTLTAEAPTPTPNATPTNTPTNTPTVTPTPLPDFSEVVLTLEDLPSGFEVLSGDEFGFTKEALSGADFIVESTFTFFEAEHFEFVWGYTSLLPTRFDQVVFDKDLDQTEIMEIIMKTLLKGFEGYTILEKKGLPDLDDIGDASAGLTVVVDVEGIPMRMDMVIFRRDKVVAFVSTFYIDGDSPIITVEDVAVKLDERIIGVLQPSN